MAISWVKFKASCKRINTFFVFIQEKMHEAFVSPSRQFARFSFGDSIKHMKCTLRSLEFQVTDNKVLQNLLASRVHSKTMFQSIRRLKESRFPHQASSLVKNLNYSLGFSVSYGQFQTPP
jgi:hypothetical protein